MTIALAKLGPREVLEKQSHLIDQVVAKATTGKFSKSDLTVLNDLLMMGQSWSRTSRASCFLLGQVISAFKEHWDELPPEFRSQYEDEFYSFVKQEYDISRNTADTYSEIWDVYFSGKYKIDTLGVKIDPLRLSIRRLKMSVPYIAAGTMNKKRWKILASSVGWTQAQVQLKEPDAKMKVTKPGKKGAVSRRIDKETGDLNLYVDGDKKEVGFLNARSNDPLITEEVNRISKLIGYARSEE